MIELFGLIPHVKAAHIATLSVWCAGLFALPLMLARHEPGIVKAEYVRIRNATYFGYVLVVTPAGLFAIGSGILLIFLRETFVPWFFAKMVFVALLVGFHVWIGYTLVAVGESGGRDDPPDPGWPLAILLVPLVAILTLVLAKPELGAIPLPGWLEEPLGLQMPFDVPRR
jgi:uncharacterized membrane protein